MHTKAAPCSSFTIRVKTEAEALIKILIMAQLRADPPSSGFALWKKLIPMAARRKGIYTALP